MSYGSPIPFCLKGVICRPKFFSFGVIVCSIVHRLHCNRGTFVAFPRTGKPLSFFGQGHISANVHVRPNAPLYRISAVSSNPSLFEHLCKWFTALGIQLYIVHIDLHGSNGRCPVKEAMPKTDDNIRA